jgi:hypothetical protein
MERKVVKLRYKGSRELSSKFKSEISKPTRNIIPITIYVEFDVQDKKDRTMITSNPKFPITGTSCSSLQSISFLILLSSGAIIKFESWYSLPIFFGPVFQYSRS